MDRREFLNLLASTGALSFALPACIGGGNSGPPDHPSALPDPRLPVIPRPRGELMTPYLVIPRFATTYRASDPLWNDWAGAQWTDFRFGPHAYWFVEPDIGDTADVVVPVINLGNSTSYHLVVELYEGPPATEATLSECELRSRIGPLVLHPGRLTGVMTQFTRRNPAGTAIAICYDPFFDPIHSILSVGRDSQNRKNLGMSHGLTPALYRG